MVGQLVILLLIVLLGQLPSSVSWIPHVCFRPATFHYASCYILIHLFALVHVQLDALLQGHQDVSYSFHMTSHVHCKNARLILEVFHLTQHADVMLCLLHAHKLFTALTHFLHFQMYLATHSCF